MAVDNKKILVTGGSGLLGGKLKELLVGAYFPERGEFDLTDIDQMRAYINGKDIELIFHGAAFTSPPKIEENPIEGIRSNILGTSNLVMLCAEKGIKLAYVSTDYVFDGSRGLYKETDPVLPINKYAWSKLGGECAVQMYDNALIIRTSFGPDEFPYPKAFVDQWTSREGVTVTAQLMVALIKKDVTGVFHVAGERKTVYEYAKSLDESKEIGELRTSDVSFEVPKDTSLDITKYKKIFGE